jgi:hypothetical protein
MLLPLRASAFAPFAALLRIMHRTIHAMGFEARSNLLFLNAQHPWRCPHRGLPSGDFAGSGPSILVRRSGRRT